LIFQNISYLCNHPLIFVTKGFWILKKSFLLSLEGLSLMKNKAIIQKNQYQAADEIKYFNTKYENHIETFLPA